MVDQLEDKWCVEGCDLEEIAAVLGKTPQAVFAMIRILGLKLTLQAKQARKERGIYQGSGRHAPGGVTPAYRFAGPLEEVKP